MFTPDLLILDGESKTTLGIIRALARRGLSIVVGCNSSLGRSSFSRYAIKSVSYHGENGIDAQQSALLKLVKKLRPKVLMPVLNTGWQIVYKHYDEYEPYTKIIPNPGKDLFEELTDKSRLAEVAALNDIPTPTTFCSKTIDDALAMRDDFPYPVLLKPRWNVGGKGIFRVDTKKHLERVLLQSSEIPIIQQFIDGEDLELTILCVDGQPIAGSAYLSLRNAPLPYGPPVACRTVKDDLIVRIGSDFLAKISYNGIAHMDFRRDKRDGQAKLLDFNARFAGTNEISTVSGVDFAYLLYKLTIGEHVNPVFEYEADKEFRWVMPGEFKHLAQTSYKLKTLKDLMRWENVSTEISLHDSLPHLALIATPFLRLFTKR